MLVWIICINKSFILWFQKSFISILIFLLHFRTNFHLFLLIVLFGYVFPSFFFMSFIVSLISIHSSNTYFVPPSMSTLYLFWSCLLVKISSSSSSKMLLLSCSLALIPSFFCFVLISLVLFFPSILHSFICRLDLIESSVSGFGRLIPSFCWS